MKAVGRNGHRSLVQILIPDQRREVAACSNPNPGATPTWGTSELAGAAQLVRCLEQWDREILE
jgi:hypothetical protein